MSDVIPPAPTRRPAQTGRVVIGLLLLLPAAMACALTQLWPTLGTIGLSFQDSRGFGSDSIFIGLDNYTALFEQGRLFQALGFALLLAISRVIAVAIVPPALGWAIGRFRGGVGALLRGLSALPALFYLPGALGLAWLITMQGLRSTGQLGFTEWLTNPTTAPVFVAFIDALAALAFGTSLCVVVFGAAARSAQPRKWMAVAWVGVIVAAAALGWQAVDLPLMLTGGGPARATTTPMLLAYQSFAQMLQIGFGAALVSLMLIPVLGLGLIAGVGLALTRPRLEAVEANNDAPAPLGLALPVLVVGGIIAGIAVLMLAWVYVTPLTGGVEGRSPDVSGLAVWSDSLLSPVAGVVVNLVLALIGGYAIGGLRPLGRGSLWLLVPFTPWLFVTPALHVFDWFLKYRALGVVGTWVSLIPPGFNTAALVTLAIVFFGIPERATGRSRGLPWVVAAALGAIWSLSVIYDLFWQFMLGGPRASTWLVIVAQSSQRLAGVDPGLWLSLWAPALVLGLGLIAWTIAFGGRLRISEER